MRIALLRGRVLDERDALNSAPVAVINQALERRLFPGEDALGRKLTARWEGKPLSLEVVGVVRSVNQARLERDAAPELYLSHAQVPFGSMTLVVRTATDPAPLLRACQRAVWSVDPLQTFARTDIVEQLVERTLADRRFLMYVASVFAAVALLLSGIGAYGLLSYLVAGRTTEIGLRVALGARSGQIVALVLREGVLLLVIGLALGLMGALGAGRALQGYLFGIGPHDPATLAAVSAAVLAVGLLAFGVPARRAARIDPAHALRSE
jgi:predicted lysophospholipase L1 biosynthesis ABC-type transport system permease subunit